MKGWRQALRRTREALSGRLGSLWPRRGGGEEGDLEGLEEVLLRADVAPALAMEWVARLGACADRPSALRALLREALGPPPSSVWEKPAGRPLCVWLVGVNGCGKTTTCAKLARRAQKEGLNPLLAATDTFRAAGAEQLRLWADRLGCQVVTGAMGADAASVAYDAAEAAQARKADLLIVDSAGRMHTRAPLMEELAKMRRSLAKRLPGAPDEIWAVLDATIGRNALAQARAFHQATPLTGLVVSKLDGSSKAGFLFSVRRELDLPVRWAGLGEEADDLEVFDPDAFVDALLAGDGEPGR